MSEAFVDEQRSELVAGLSELYRPGLLHAAGTPTSDGRGGFTASTTQTAIMVQREDLAESLVKRNIAPNHALIFILNDGSAVPKEGNSIEFQSRTYMISKVTLDPVGAVYECDCENG